MAEVYDKVKENYAYDVGASHNFVVIAPDTVDYNDIQSTMSDFNRKYFSTRGLKTSLIPLKEGRVMVIVSNIGISNRAMDYYGTF